MASKGWGAPAAWGSPAAGSAVTNMQGQDSNPQQNESMKRQSHNQPNMPTPRHQRPGPYHNNSHSGRGRNNNSGNTYQGRRQNDSPNHFQDNTPDFSPNNPYQSNVQSFSSENPFQNKNQNFSPGNPFQQGGQPNSPNPHPPMPQPRFQSSPLTHTPRGMNPNFSPRTPGRRFQTPSPVGFSPGTPRGFTPRHRGSSERHFGQRNFNRGMNNPGGSNNINDYIHPSMLEDPWKDLPATPMLHSY